MSDSDRSDAFTILKSGDIGIGVSPTNGVKFHLANFDDEVLNLRMETENENNAVFQFFNDNDDVYDWEFLVDNQENQFSLNVSGDNFLNKQEVVSYDEYGKRGILMLSSYSSEADIVLSIGDNIDISFENKIRLDEDYFILNDDFKEVEILKEGWYRVSYSLNFSSNKDELDYRVSVLSSYITKNGEKLDESNMNSFMYGRENGNVNLIENLSTVSHTFIAYFSENDLIYVFVENDSESQAKADIIRSGNTFSIEKL